MVARRVFAIAAGILLSVALPAMGQLINPNNNCYYPVGSTECVPIPRQAPQPQQGVPLPPLSNSGGNSCEANCRAEQRVCMQSGGDFYRNFSRCGEQQTLCMQHC